MNQINPRLFDEINANLKSSGSRLLNSFPRLERKFNGEDPLRQSVRWLHPIRTEPSLYDRSRTWLEFAPTDKGSRLLPKGFSGVAHLSLYQGTVEALQATAEEKSRDAFQAVAYKLGSTALVGISESADRQLFTQSESDKDRLEIGMLVGPKALQASIGLYYPDRKDFVMMHDPRSNGGVTPRQNNVQPYV